MKKFFIFGLVIFSLLSAASCFASTFTNDGMNLTIPEDIEALLTVEVPENDARGILFTVSETESIEAAKKQDAAWDGAGFLFSIGRASEKAMHEMLCNDMSGQIVFAGDGKGTYYVFYHPTDVRMVREDYQDQEAIGRWTTLNEWAGTVRDSFIAENEGLTAEQHGNTVLDIDLARILYQEGTHYTVSTTEFGPIEAGKVDAAEFIKPLTENVVYEIVDGEEAPDGEYVVLNFPEDDVRFDFFKMEGKENYVRQVWSQEQNEMLYKAVFADETIKASRIMEELYQAMVKAENLK